MESYKFASLHTHWAIQLGARSFVGLLLSMMLIDYRCKLKKA